MTAGRLAAAGIAVTVLVAIVVVLAGNPLSPSPSPSPRPTVEAPTATAPPSQPATPSSSVACHGPEGPLPSALSSDPCPSAIAAVQLAVAPVRLPIDRMVIEPGPFFCDMIWPGFESAAPCYGPAYRPGQYMHAWVSFTGSTKVAAVALGLDLPSDLDTPGQTRPPWRTTVLAVEAPPNGWLMP